MENTEFEIDPERQSFLTSAIENAVETPENVYEQARSSVRRSRKRLAKGAMKNKTMLMAIGGVVLVGIIGVVIYTTMKNKKKSEEESV